jgi:hypothetical protein
VSEASGTAKILGDVVGAVRDAVGQAVEGAPVDQLGFELDASERHLSLPDAQEIADIQDELGCDVSVAVQEHRKRHRGRKPGAKNKRSGDLARYLMQFGPHPGVAMMRILARPAEMLAAEMGCKKLEALDRQIRVAAELMPYFEGKKPIDVNVNANGHMTLIIGGGGAMDGGMLEAHSTDVPELSFPDQETAENRGFGGSDGGQSE